MFTKKNSLSTVRKAVVDYYKNPVQHIDLSQGVEHYDGSRFIVTMKSFQEVSGLQFLGNGCYADVYAIDDYRVLKIIKNVDSGYARFVEIVKNNSQNPHFPKIMFSGEWAGKTVYILERLQNEPETDVHAWDSYGDRIDLNSAFRQAIRQRSKNPFLGFATPDLAQVADLFREHNLGNDLHAGNVMFRGNTPVVTDPCTY